MVIVGAGPGGLNCAKKLSESSLKILLLEKNEVIGPKVCAGGLKKQDLDYLKLPERLLDCKFKEVIIHTPYNKDIIKQKEYFVYTIDRKTLGQWQLKGLKKTNVVIRKNSRVTNISKNMVTVNNSYKVKFRYLVGADGSSSIVRRHLGLSTNEEGAALQYNIPSKKYRKMQIFLDSDLFHSWYAYIFPRKDYVSIGCGAGPHFLSAKKLKENFNKWLKRNNIDVSKGEFQANPINFDYEGHRFKNKFLVGDACGLASGFTGEGIHQALISGEEIAKMIMDKNYVSNPFQELLKTKKLHDRLLHFFEKSGKTRKIEHELLALLLKNKILDKKIINIVA